MILSYLDRPLDRWLRWIWMMMCRGCWWSCLTMRQGMVLAIEIYGSQLNLPGHFGIIIRYRYIYIQHTYKRKIIYIYIYALPLFEQFFFQVPVDPMNCVVCFTSTHLTDGHPRCFFHHFPMARCVLPSREHEALLSALDRKPSTGGLGTIIVVLVCSYCVLSACIVWTIDPIISLMMGFE